MRLADICKDKKYLVTGATGFIGRAVCQKLLDAGAVVHGLARREAPIESDRWTYSALDLADAAAVDDVFSTVRPEFVIHLASCVTGKREVNWVRETMLGNLVSAVHVMTAAQANGVEKCVMAGSLEEPDETEARPVPASPYAASKWSASAYSRMMHALYGLNLGVARIFMVYGPGQQDTNKLVPYVCLSANRGQAPQLMSGGRPVDWIFIDDAAEGLIRMAHAGPVDGSYVDLGSGQLVTTGDIAERICSIADSGVTPDFGAVPDRAMEQVRVADAEATETELGWTPATGLDKGLEITYRWYQDYASDDA
ncbi:MAG: NAD-dependent epimerase/dehydratase family protein [Woeseiaceae bacterium]